MRLSTILYISILGLGVVLVGCMEPDLEYVPTAIRISNARITDITTCTANVVWATTADSYSRVIVISDDSVTNTFYNPSATRSHSMEITRLLPDTSYMLLLHSSNRGGASSFETGARLAFQTQPLLP